MADIAQTPLGNALVRFLVDDTIVSYMLRHVERVKVLSSEDFTRHRNAHTPTAYGCWQPFHKYIVDDRGVGFSGHYRDTDSPRTPLLGRAPHPKHTRWSMIRWIGPPRSVWITMLTLKQHDRVFSYLEKLMLEERINAHRLEWLELLRR